jgi:hypothetical protein
MLTLFQERRWYDIALIIDYATASNSFISSDHRLGPDIYHAC